MYLRLHMFILYVTIIDEKGVQEFEKVQGGIYGKIWMKEQEEMM